MRKRWFALLLALGFTLGTCWASFEDVDSGAWYAAAVDYAAEWGWIRGMPDGSFKPDAPTSRAMLVTVLYRQAGAPGSAWGASFGDVPVTGWFYDAVAWAAERGYVTGYSEDWFGPEDPVSREQMATVLWRLEGSPKAQGVGNFSDLDQVSDYAREAVVWVAQRGLMGGKGDGRFDPKSTATRAETATILYRLATGAVAP